MVHTALLLASSLLVIYFVRLYVEFRKAVRGIGNFPGKRLVITSPSILSGMLPAIPGFTPGPNWMVPARFDDFHRYGWDAFSYVSIWPRPRTMLYLADPAAIKELTTYRSRFPKPVEDYEVLSMYGHNIVASEGDEWKKIRKIAAPAFSERNNKLVWDETVRIMVDMFDNVWHNESTIVVDHAVEITLPIALFVIGVAGFGRNISWNADTVVPPGRRMTLKAAINVMSYDVIWKLILPEWALNLTPRLRNVRLAYDELEKHMEALIHERRNGEKVQERHDLFSNLLDASQQEMDADAKLSDRELMGNIFIFLLAGHETTAHTLCFCFALLAMYPDEQDRLYQEIRKITPDDSRLPTYEEMPLFTYSMAVFYETLRLMPPAPGIPKKSEEDTTITVSNQAGEKTTIPIPKGTDFTFHLPGLHHNPRYWKDPLAFKPERFLGDWPRDAFLPFSGGARACLGRRFFETEGIAVLTMLVSKYRIEVTEEPRFVGETFDQRYERVMRSRPGLTTVPVRVPLTFKRR
ncbi:cytochrome P450 [Gloeopeniophorella convolvens]|nr:cytochrome P450 [Gloeopeniophorella convolvens]